MLKNTSSGHYKPQKYSSWVHYSTEYSLQQYASPQTYSSSENYSTQYTVPMETCEQTSPESSSYSIENYSTHREYATQYSQARETKSLSLRPIDPIPFNLARVQIPEFYPSPLVLPTPITISSPFQNKYLIDFNEQDDDDYQE